MPFNLKNPFAKEPPKRSVFDDPEIVKDAVGEAIKAAQESVKQNKDKLKRHFNNPGLQAIWDEIKEKIESGEITIEDLTIGGKTKDELVAELKKNNIKISEYAQHMLDNPEFTASPEVKELKLIKLTVADLDLTNGATTDEIYARASELGLDLCPAEVGPYLRIKDSAQSLHDSYLIAMEQLTDRNHRPLIFKLICSTFGLTLQKEDARHNLKWNAKNPFVFILRK